MRLTKAQKLALTTMAARVGYHVSGIDNRTLKSLADRGLVRFGYDTRQHQYVEEITPYGREAVSWFGHRRQRTEARK